MKLDQRQKVLLGTLVGFLILWQGGGVVWGLVFGPLEARNAQIATLDEQLEKKRRSEFELQLAERRLRLYERRSLPPDPTVASTLYHHWLLDLASRHRFQRLTVTPKRVGITFSQQTFSPISVSLNAECSMENLCRFLFEFYKTDLLHKVKHLGIESTEHSKNPKLKVNLDLEALALKKAPSRNSLFSEKMEQSIAVNMSKKSLADYDLLIDQNRFERGYNGPPRPPILPPPPPAPFDSAPHVKLVGSIEVNGQPEAWLFDQSANIQVVLTKGKRFEIAGVKGDVLEIGKDYVLLKVDQKDWRLDLGENLKQLKSVQIEAKPTVAVPNAAPADPSTPDSSETGSSSPAPANTNTPAGNSSTNSPQHPPATPVKVPPLEVKPGSASLQSSGAG